MGYYSRLGALLEPLSPRKRLAFAAICSDRIVEELKTLKPHLARSLGVLCDAQAFVWRVVRGEWTEPRDEARSFMSALEVLCPINEDDARHEEIVFCAAEALCMTLSIILDTADSVRWARNVGIMVFTVHEVYFKDSERLESEEELWQENTLALLLDLAEDELQKGQEVFVSVAEYDKGACRNL